MTQARRQGFRVEVHAIGDRALAAVLDAFSAAGVISCERPIITHCQVTYSVLRTPSRRVYSRELRELGAGEQNAPSNRRVFVLEVEMPVRFPQNPCSLYIFPLGIT